MGRLKYKTVNKNRENMVKGTCAFVNVAIRCVIIEHVIFKWSLKQLNIWLQRNKRQRCWSTYMLSIFRYHYNIKIQYWIFQTSEMIILSVVVFFCLFFCLFFFFFTFPDFSNWGGGGGGEQFRHRIISREKRYNQNVNSCVICFAIVSKFIDYSFLRN